MLQRPSIGPSAKRRRGRLGGSYGTFALFAFALACLLWTTAFLALPSLPGRTGGRERSHNKVSMRTDPGNQQQNNGVPAAQEGKPPSLSLRQAALSRNSIGTGIAKMGLMRQGRFPAQPLFKHMEGFGRVKSVAPPVPGFQCLGWRQTGGCSPDGPREEASDLPCSSKIPKGASGYCEILDKRGPGEPRTVAAMRMNCTSQPAEWLLKGTKMRCEDAAAFHVFAEESLKYRAPSSAVPEVPNTDQRDKEGAAPAGQQQQQQPSPSPPTRGIVICISDRVMVSAYAVVMVLRSKGCALPIELWHLKGELHRALPVADALVAKSGGSVRVRALKETRNSICHIGTPKCFNVKIHTLYNAGFDQVLLLDADNFVLRDPTYIFDSPEMLANGAIFWPDFWRPGNSVFNIEPWSLLWELTGVPFVDSFEQESGQLLVDRQRHARALEVLMFYALPNNILHNYALVYGDKDLFRLAWMSAGASFHMVPRGPGWVGELGRKGFCGMTIAQYDPKGESVIFLHRNSFKLDERKLSQRRVWQALVEHLPSSPEDPNEGYWGHIWIPKAHDQFAVGTEPCYGPANITEGFRRLSVLADGADETMGAISALEGELLRQAAEASRIMTPPGDDDDNAEPPPPKLGGGRQWVKKQPLGLRLGGLGGNGAGS